VDVLTGAFGPVPLTPTSLLRRAAAIAGTHVAVLDGDLEFTYAELLERCERLAGALAGLGVEPGDRVSVLAPNVHVALEAHFAVPFAGAVLNALNTRLSAAELGYIMGHAASRLLLVDPDFEVLGRKAASVAGCDVAVVVADGEFEKCVAEAEPRAVRVVDEHSLLSLNYTSGTTGRPKGVMYSHRGAYLQSLAMMAQAGLDQSTRFLWTLPMFHCNGWCFPWAVTGVAGTHVCLPRVEPARIWRSIREQRITHFNAAPTVLVDIVNAPEAAEVPPQHSIRVATGGAPPSPTLIARLEDLHIDVTHLYGLTETYGPAVICDWRREWDALDTASRAVLKARQGVSNVVGEAVRVVHDGADVPRDGKTVGEVLLRGNNVMLGYYGDPEATAAAMFEGWFRTGDSGVLHDDGYLELRDRLKDVIISGGENIASIEIEHALASHPGVLECAVVAAPDERWGEVPVAFVTIRGGQHPTAPQLITHVKERIARFKAPKRVVFGPLPKTATGKVKKYELRERCRLDAADSFVPESEWQA
jgi:fatty-acyl-CoA synthase